MISSGIYVPRALAGDGNTTSPSRTNPFAFPAYDSPERMDVDRYVDGENAVRYRDSDLGRFLEFDTDAEIPMMLADQWKDYTR